MVLNTEKSDFDENLQAKMKNTFKKKIPENFTNTAFSQKIDVFQQMSEKQTTIRLCRLAENGFLSLDC